jgi:methionine-rich copper-binding protein CopC
VAGAATALAHTAVVSTTPRDGARLARPPAVVAVTYGSPLEAAGEATVRGPGAAAAGTPRLRPADARTVVVPLRGLGRGRYEVAWTAVGADGHELAGSLRFVVRRPAIVAELHELGALVRRAARALETAPAATADQR